MRVFWLRVYDTSGIILKLLKVSDVRLFHSIEERITLVKP